VEGNVSHVGIQPCSSFVFDCASFKTKKENGFYLKDATLAIPCLPPCHRDSVARLAVTPWRGSEMQLHEHPKSFTLNQLQIGKQLARAG